MNKKFILCNLIILVSVIYSDPMMANTFKTLHQFSALDTNMFNTDGANPSSTLTALGNILYGTALQGGSAGNGTIFAVRSDGTGFKVLHTFTAMTNVGSANLTNSDGAGPEGDLLLSWKTLYGTAVSGGSNGVGTIFGINPDGTGFTNLYTFTGGSDGAHPRSRLIASGSTLYGTTSGEGADHGTIYLVSMHGTGFRTLYRFTGGADGSQPNGLILSGNKFYGTTLSGGLNGAGTVFSINTDGTGFTNIYSFSAATLSSQFHSYTNSDGAYPKAKLILLGNTLYGRTSSGSYYGGGTLFGVNTDGTGIRNLYTFGIGDGSAGELTLSGITLYGTAAVGGSNAAGSIFAIATNDQSVNFHGRFLTRTRVPDLYTFSPLAGELMPVNKDGALPAAGLLLSGNTLYGTASAGGRSGSGTVYSLNISPSATHTISVSASPSVGGTVSGGGTFASDGWNTVTATNKPNYLFDHWTVNGTDVSANPSYSFTLDGDISLVANFIPISYTIAVNASPVAGGIVTGNGTFAVGSTNLVTATPNSGYGFDSWTTNGMSVSTMPNYTFTLKGDVTFIANFPRITNTVAVLASPVAGGTVIGAGKYAQGSPCVVVATPTTGFSFNNWTDKGINVGSSLYYYFTVTNNIVLVANFTQPTYTISVSASPSIGGTETGAGTFPTGSIHTVNATPKSGFRFVSWTLMGNLVSTFPDYTFALYGNEALVANFQPIASP
jgi:uncharacterized repeat protein (TIGR03803 family)